MIVSERPPIAQPPHRNARESRGRPGQEQNDPIQCTVRFLKHLTLFQVFFFRIILPEIIIFVTETVILT